jgi:hypothetical protein
VEETPKFAAERKKDDEAQSMAPRLYHRSVTCFRWLTCKVIVLFGIAPTMLGIQLDECSNLSDNFNCVVNFVMGILLVVSSAFAFVGLYFAGVANKKANGVRIRSSREGFDRVDMSAQYS